MGQFEVRARLKIREGRARLGRWQPRPAAMSSSLQIRLLGPFEALVGGRPAEVTGPKRHALLALLAVRGGRVVPVEVLVDALWGEQVPVAPRNAVQHHISRLRAALGAESIVAAPDGYALVGATVDALGLEELLARARSAGRAGDAGQAAELVARALALWRGRPLQGLPDSPWVGAEAARLEGLRTDALEEQFEAALALGEHTEVVGRIRRVLEEQPFRERLWGQLLLALYRSGRQAEALAAFGQARRVLAEELGVEPGPGLQRLQAAILAHDPVLASVPPAAAPRGRLPAVDDARVRAAETRARAAEQALQGAQTELARRTAALDRAQDRIDALELAADERDRAADAPDTAGNNAE